MRVDKSKQTCCQRGGWEETVPFDHFVLIKKCHNWLGPFQDILFRREPVEKDMLNVTHTQVLNDRRLSLCISSTQCSFISSGDEQGWS